MHLTLGNNKLELILIVSRRGKKISSPLQESSPDLQLNFYRISNIDKIATPDQQGNLKVIFRKLFNTVKIAITVLRLFIQRPNGTIILTDAVTWTGLIAYLTALRWRLPLVWRARGDVITELEEQKKYFFLFFFKFLFIPKVIGIVFVSRYLEKKTIAQFPKISFKKMMVVFTPQRVFATSITSFTQRKEELLIVTNFDYWNKVQGIKNYLDQIIFFLEKNKSFNLTILGSGRYCLEFEKKNNHQQIIFKGFESNLEKYYGRAFALLHLSGLDAYPSVINEARAHGLPVITNKDVGMKEMICDQKDGFFIQPKVRDISQIINELKNKEKWLFISNNGIKRVLKENSYKKIGNDFRNALGKLMDHDKNPLNVN